MPEPAQTAMLGRYSVRRIGFGAMQLAGPGVFGPPGDPDAARALLRRAVELGVDHIDTSQYYGPSVVNELIREALAPYLDGLRIVSKVGARRDDAGAWLPAQRPEELRAGVEENLATLGVESLAAVNLRLIGAHGDRVPLAEQLGALEDLRREGRIAAIGISNTDRATVEEALDIVDLVCVQNAYSIIERGSQDVLDLCSDRGIPFVPFFPLGSAFTGGPAAIAADPRVAGVAARHGVTAAQVALAWLLHLDPHILLIPGTSSLGHLEENLAAATVRLDDRDMAELDLAGGARVTEIERKFLVADVPADLASLPSTQIRQGYVAIDADGTEVRIRDRDDAAVLTVKQGAGRSRAEEELDLGRESFDRLWPLTAGRRIEKCRTVVPAASGLTIEVDVYAGELAGLVVAEVEFPDEHGADAFEPPPWFGQEVTDDPAFKNQNLARDGRPGQSGG